MAVQKMNEVSERGQVALIVLLLLTISLTIGLSLIARTVNELRVTSNSERSAQAYAAAEAGIEEALVNEGLNKGDAKELDLGNSKMAKFTITEKTDQGDSSEPFILPKTYEKDEAAQVWLFNYKKFLDNNLSNEDFFLSPESGTTSNQEVRFYWGTPDQTETEDKKPALEVTVIYAKVTSGNLSDFRVTKYPFRTGNQTNNFNSAESGSTVAGTTFSHSAPVTLTKTANEVPILIRLKLLYNDKKHSIAIDPNPNSSGGPVLPGQGSIVDSTGESGNVVRKLRVYQSYPTLPGIFDFVLFNNSSNPLEKTN